MHPAGAARPRHSAVTSREYFGKGRSAAPSPDVPRSFCFSPRVVLGGEAEAVGERRMRVEPERDEGGGVGIGEIGLAEELKGFGRGARGIGDQSVDRLEA